MEERWEGIPPPDDDEDDTPGPPRNGPLDGPEPALLPLESFPLEPRRTTDDDEDFRAADLEEPSPAALEVVARFPVDAPAATRGTRARPLHNKPGGRQKGVREEQPQAPIPL